MSKELLLRLRQYIADKIEACTRLKFKDSQEAEAEYNSGVEDALRDVERWIDERPVNDMKPMLRAEWIRDPQTGLCVCSNCGKVAPYTAHADWIEYWPVLDFCNACGADMGERSEE